MFQQATTKYSEKQLFKYKRNISQAYPRRPSDLTSLGNPSDSPLAKLQNQVESEHEP